MVEGRFGEDSVWLVDNSTLPGEIMVWDLEGFPEEVMSEWDPKYEALMMCSSGAGKQRGVFLVEGVT